MERSWGFLGRSWALLGRSLGALGRLCGAIGMLSGVLGPFFGCSGGAFGMVYKNHQTSLPQTIDFGSLKGDQIAPKRNPKESMSKTNRDTKNNTLEDWLEAVLGRSWYISGTILGPLHGS